MWLRVGELGAVDTIPIKNVYNKLSNFPTYSRRSRITHPGLADVVGACFTASTYTFRIYVYIL